MLGLAAASALILAAPDARARFYAAADGWLHERRGDEVLAVRMELAQAADRARIDPRAAAAITSRLAARLRRRGGFWAPLEAQALEGSAAAARASGDVEAELAARRALLTLQPGRSHRRAELGECMVRIPARREEGLRLLRRVFARDPSSLTALLPLVLYALADRDDGEAKRLVARYERAPLLPQSMVEASRLSAVRLLGSDSGSLAAWPCAPPIDGAPHLLRLPMAGKPEAGEAAAVTITITVGPACGALTLHHLDLRRIGTGSLLRLAGETWPTMEVIGGNRVGPDHVVIRRDRIRIGFRLPRLVPLSELDALELRLTLRKRFPAPLDTLRSKRP